jgi:hypothetical protein
MEIWSESMIELELTKAEALLFMELIRENTEQLLEQISHRVEDEITQMEMEGTAQENYQANLKIEADKVPDLEAEIVVLRAKIDSMNLSSKLNKIKFPEINLNLAPYGYKKDGTPKKRTGRPRTEFELPF